MTARIFRAAFIAVVVLGLGLYAHTIDWRETGHRIASANWALLSLALVVNLVSLVTKALLWWIFLRPIGVGSLVLATEATFVGAGLNNILVANSGEAARVVVAARKSGVDSAKVLATLALERMCEAIGYILLLVLSLSLIDLPRTFSAARPIAWFGFAGAVVLVVYLVRSPERPETSTSGERGWFGRLRAFMREFIRTARRISTARRFAAALVVAAVTWALQWWTYALTARAANVHLSAVGTLAAFLAVNLGFAVRATPGNVGVFQATYALVATGFGVDRDSAIAVACLIQALQLIPVTVIGVALAPELVFARPKATRQEGRAEPEGSTLHASTSRARL